MNRIASLTTDRCTYGLFEDPGDGTPTWFKSRDPNISSRTAAIRETVAGELVDQVVLAVLDDAGQVKEVVNAHAYPDAYTEQHRHAARHFDLFCGCL